MRQDQLCLGVPTRLERRGYIHVGYYGDIVRDEIKPQERKALKRFRLKCPICGRRVLSSIRNDDGQVVHEMPPHKPKGWWKSRG